MASARASLVRTLGTALFAAACASAPTPRPDDNPAYPGRCSFVELTAVPSPSPGRGSGPDNLGSDSLELVATYRPGGDPARRPVSYAFRVREEQVDDLRAHLQQQPEILCEGELTGEGERGAAGTPDEQGPIFEGQRGRRLPDEEAQPPATGGD